MFVSVASGDWKNAWFELGMDSTGPNSFHNGASDVTSGPRRPTGRCRRFQVLVDMLRTVAPSARWCICSLITCIRLERCRLGGDWQSRSDVTHSRWVHCWGNLLAGLPMYVAL